MAEKTPKTPKGKAAWTPEQKETLRSLLDLYPRLVELVDWYEKQQRIEGYTRKTPVFKRGDNPKYSGIVLNRDIFDRTREKLKDDREFKSLSQLIEYLLWQYAGEPEDVIE